MPFWRPGPQSSAAENSTAGDDWVRNPANVVVLVPGEHVLTVTTKVPGRSAAQIRRALPYVVEEFIAGDIERIHLVSGAVRRGQPVCCCMIDSGLLQDWLTCLATLGVRPGYLVSEAQLLPIQPRGASVLIDNGKALLRTEDQAATVDRGNLLPALQSLDVDRLTLVNGALTDIEAGQLDIDIETTGESAPAGEGTLLEYLAGCWLRQHSAVNLLHGEYAAELPRDTGTVKWRSLTMLAAAWLLLGLASMLATGIWFSHRADSLEGASLALYRDIFPNDRTATVQNIRRRMRARLGERPDVAGRSIIEFAGELAAVMDQSMTLVGIDYNEARGEFATELMVGRYDDIDRVREALVARGLSAEITSAEQVEQGVQARLRMSGS